MTTEQKIEEILRLVRNHDEQFREIRELFQSERQFNTVRFSHMATKMDVFSTELREVKKEMRSGFQELRSEIDLVYRTLSQDIQVFAEDLNRIKRKVERGSLRPERPER